MNIEYLKKASKINLVSGRVIELDKKYNYQNEDIVFTEKTKDDDGNKKIKVISEGEYKDSVITEMFLLNQKLEKGKIQQKYHDKKMSSLAGEVFTGPYIVEDGKIALPKMFEEEEIEINPKTESKFLK